MRAPVQWIPEIAEAFCRSQEPGTALARRTHRLGTDKRLASVWRTLADHCDDGGVTALFLIAHACCDERLGAVTRKELEEKAAQFRKGAQHLHHLERLVRRPGDPRKQVLRDAAKACEELAKTAVSDVHPGLVVERQIDPQARGFVVYFSTYVQAMCGQPFDKLVGTIATVALDLKKPLSTRTVEYWRTHRGS
jgi:hypothetical protein